EGPRTRSEEDAMTDTVTFEEIKAKQQRIRSGGAYGKIARITVPVAEPLAAVGGLRPGSRLLGRPTGPGHVAWAAARRVRDGAGRDCVPPLVDSPHRRAAAEDLDIDFREADAEDLPFDDATFDYTLSAIGVMFTADHQRAANELVRVTRPGGR